MNIDELLKKRLLFFFISFIFIAVVAVSSSYALINSDVNKGKVINNGNLKIFFENGDEVINSGYPMSYQQGIKDSPSNIIKIKNNTTSKTKFALYIHVNDSANSLDVNKIYYSINDSKPNILGRSIQSSLYSKDLDSDEEYILDIKAWASSELIDNSDQGKEVELLFEVKEIE